MAPHLISNAAIVACLAILVAASVHDIAARTIPNWMAVTLAALGITLRIADHSALAALVAASIVFCTAAFCWRRGWLGGGDVKLLAAAALAVPPAAVFSLVTAVAIDGGILAFIYIAARRIVPAPKRERPDSLLARILRAEAWRIRRGGPLPYALAITVGASFILSQRGLT